MKRLLMALGLAGALLLPGAVATETASADNYYTREEVRCYRNSEGIGKLRQVTVHYDNGVVVYAVWHDYLYPYRYC